MVVHDGANADDFGNAARVYWSLKSYHDITTQASTRNGTVLEGLWFPNGTVDEAKLRLLSRTFAPAVAGATLSMQFSPTTGAFTLSFAATATIADPTVVFLNRRLFYPRGAAVTVTPSGALSWKAGAMENYLEFSFAQGVTSGQHINISITAM